jgi:hypothetical protein
MPNLPDIEPNPSGASYDRVVAEFERDMIRQTNREMRGRSVEVVHATLVERLHGRLPGVPINDLHVRRIARAIARGTLPD